MWWRNPQRGRPKDRIKMNKYYIICLDDMVCYDSKETKLQADLRAQYLANKNPGRVYIVTEAKTGYQCKFENVKLVVEDLEG